MTTDFVKCMLFNCRNDKDRKTANDPIILNRENIGHMKDFIFNLNAETVAFAGIHNSFANFKDVFKGIYDKHYEGMSVDRKFHFIETYNANNINHLYLCYSRGLIRELGRIVGQKTEYIYQVFIFEKGRENFCVINLNYFNSKKETSNTKNIDINLTYPFQFYDKDDNNKLDAARNIGGHNADNFKEIYLLFKANVQQNYNINIDIGGFKINFNMMDSNILPISMANSKIMYDIILYEEHKINLELCCKIYANGDMFNIIEGEKFKTTLDTVKIDASKKETMKKTFINLINVEGQTVHIKDMADRLTGNVDFLEQYYNVLNFSHRPAYEHLINLNDEKIIINDMKAISQLFLELPENNGKEISSTKTLININTYNKTPNNNIFIDITDDDRGRKLFNHLLNVRYPEIFTIKKIPLKYSINDDTTQYIGIQNEGATCFFATFIQALYSIEELRHKILNYASTPKPEKNQDYAYSVLKEIFKLYEASKTSKTIMNTKTQIEKLETQWGKLFNKGIQNDSAEVFQELLYDDFITFFCERIIYTIYYNGIFYEYKNMIYNKNSLPEIYEHNYRILNINIEQYKNKTFQYVFTQELNKVIVENEKKNNFKKYTKTTLEIYLTKYTSNYIFISVNRISGGNKITSKLGLSPLLYNKPIFYRILGVMLHTGSSLGGHYVYVSFNTKGEIKCVCNDSNIDTTESTIKSYKDIIETQGTYFIYEKYILTDDDKKKKENIKKYKDIINEYNDAIKGMTITEKDNKNTKKQNKTLQNKNKNNSNNNNNNYNKIKN